MPHLISFMLTRLAVGYLIGMVAALAIWCNGGIIATAANPFDGYLAQALFMCVFANTVALGYLSTALFLDDL